MSRCFQYCAQTPTFLQEGHSVLANITDFLPYFYIPVPRGFLDSDITAFSLYLNVSPLADNPASNPNKCLFRMSWAVTPSGIWNSSRSEIS